MSTVRTLAAAQTLTLLVAAPAVAGTSFTFPMTGAQEVPAVASPFHGKCVGILSDDEMTFELHCTHDIPNPSAAHIHRGTPDEAGPVIFDLGDGTSPIQATWNPTNEEVADLLVGNLYVNVHTPANPPGEIRGQIRVDNRVGEGMTAFPLEEGQEVPPSGVAASGQCLLTGTVEEQSLTCVHDLGLTTAAHIHVGARGVNGGVVVDLGDGMSPIRADLSLTHEQIPMLLAGMFYVNVHTSEHPDGALRGQIDGCFGGGDTLCLNRGRFAVTAEWEVAPDHPFLDSGSGTAIPLTDDSGGFWFFDPDNIEIQVKVLDACAPPFGNDRFWVFAAGLTNVRVTLTVRDTVTGEENVYENELGTAFQPILDTDAFATCI